MDKTVRLKYTFDAASNDALPNDSSPQNVQLMALVIGVMSAVTAEVKKCAEEETANHTLAALVEMLPPPSPDLHPDQVLRIQLSALKANDVPTTNHGIEVAHRFCTAESRAILGTPSQFAQLFRDPMYSPLLNFKSVTFEPTYLKSDRASVRFTVSCAKGCEANYIAHLVVEISGPDVGCWMTDSILRRCS